jgi:ABC-type amino acid transport substrate-binding protein
VKNKMLAAVVLIFSIAAQPARLHAQSGLSGVAEAWLSEHKVLVFSVLDAHQPFEFIDPDTREYSGLNVELIRWIATELGFTATFIPLSSAEARDALLDGRVDVITGVFKNPERAARFDLSTEMFPLPVSIFTRKDRNDIASSNDREGKRLALPRDDHAIEYLKSTGIGVDIVYTDDFRSAMSLVLAGKVDAMISDEQIVVQYIAEKRLETQIQKVSEPLYIGQNHLVVAKGDSILLSILDAGIQRARDTGTLETIYKKWTGLSLASDKATGTFIRSVTLRIALLVVIASAILILVRMARQRIRLMMDAERMDLEKTVTTLREENEALSAANATLRRDIEERSRLEEEKRRIDAEVAARRVEELTRCAIAAALESTQTDAGKAR